MDVIVLFIVFLRFHSVEERDPHISLSSWKTGLGMFTLDKEGVRAFGKLPLQ